MADLSKLRFNGTDYNVKDASAPTRKFTNTYSKTGNLPITSDDTIQSAIGKLENNMIPKSTKGTANGVAELDANGKVPSSQLPSYVDDVLEYSAKSSFPATGESGKIYVDTTTNKTYRWSGSAYVEISESLALGETDSTAYRGDRGKTAYDHSQLTSGNPHNVTKSDVGLGNVGNFKAVSTAASQGLSDTEKSNARANIGAGTGNGTYSKPSGGIPKSDLASAVQTSLDQVATNQTNILYTLGKTGRNHFKLDMSVVKNWNTGGTWNGNVYAQGGLTFTFNSDGTIDVSGTATERVNVVLDVYYPLNTEIGYRFNELDGLVLSGCPTGGAWNRYSLSLQMTDSPWTSAATDTGSGGTIDKSALPSTTACVAFYLTIYASYPTSSFTFKPMFCTQEDWSISHDYTPYGGIPNYDLTRMVSELQKKAVKVYTYHVNPNESDPEDAVTYLDDATGLTPAKMGASSFSYGSWANAWFLPRPCVLKFDGTVDYYLNPNDYSKKTDGTASTIDSSNSTGNVMLEFPKIWVKRVNDGNGARTVSIAPVNVDGTYKCWSNINAEDKEVDHFYLPAYNGTIHSSKMRSLSGVTLNTTYAPNYTRAQDVTAATANNPTGKNLWYTETWADFCLIYDLLYLMGKSLDVQRTFGQGLSNGAETAMRAYVTGTHNAKGLFYGDVSGTSTAVKVLGMENLWGCRWHGVAGLINDNGTLKVKMTYGVADGSTTVGYNTTGSGYLNYGSTYGAAGYVKKMQADNTMGYKIIETAGTNATYYCDYYYVNNSQSSYALLGGRSGNDAACGFCVSLDIGAAYASESIGGSLSCRP